MGMTRRWILALTAFCLIVGSVTFAVFATGGDGTDVPVSSLGTSEVTTEVTTAPTTAATTEATTEATTTATETTTEATTEATTEVTTEATTEATTAPTEPPAAASGKCGASMTWSFSGGKLTISGSGAMDEIEDYSNHPWEAWESQVKSIEFGPDIRSISKYAFYGCSNVTSIRFTGSVPGTIDSNAFKGITAKVKYPGLDPEWAKMEKKNYGGTLTWEPEVSGTGGVFGDNFVWKLEGSTLTIVGKGNMDGWTSGSGNPPWYAHRSSIKKVVMSGRIYCIYTGAFRDMTNLSEIVWPDDLTIIYSSAFHNCTGLSSIKIPSSVHTIESYAFQNCSNLSSVTLPKSLKKLGQNAFANCKGLRSLTLPDGLETIGKKAFSGSSLNKIEIPAKITKLEAETFLNCTHLAEVTIKGDVKEIGNSCFEGCSKLNRLDLPASVKTIGESAFAGSGLTELVFKGDIPTIGANALKGLKAILFYPADNSSWGTGRMQVLQNTYSNAISFYAGTPETFVAPTEAPTAPPTEAATEAATLPVVEQPEEEIPVMTEETIQATEMVGEPLYQQPEEPEKKPGILSYWPLLVAAIWFFGGSALAVWFLLIRPGKRGKRSASKHRKKGARSSGSYRR